MTTPTTRKVSDLTSVGTIQAGDKVVGERTSGTTVLLTYAPVADGDYGDVTISGSGAVFTVDLPSSATVATDDKVYIFDTSASNAKKYVTAQSIADLTTVTQYTDEMAQDAVGSMVDATLTYVDGTPLLQRAALIGDVTASAGSNATTIANDAVTYAKIQNVSATDKLLGRSSSGSGDVEEITCTAAGRALLDDASASDQRTTLGLAIGTNVQAWDADLDTLSTAFTTASASGAASLKFAEDTDNGSNSVTLQGPASTADVTLTLPAATDTLVGKATTDTLTNKTIDADANTITNIENADIKAAAAIAVNKLAAVTADRAIVSDGSGFVSAATTTATEIGYVNGVTSAIQTQLNAKQASDATLTALAAYNTNGILTQTAADTFAGRTITGTANQITVSNGDGVSGNPTLSIPYNLALGSSATGPSSVDFFEDTDNGSNKVTLIAPSSIASDKTITLQDVTGTVYVTGGTDVAVADGGTGLSSTTINQILYSSAADTIAGLATANSATLITSSGGVPSWIQAPGFYATGSGNTAAVTATYTTIALATEIFDVNNCYSTSTYRFTPNVAGTYLIIGAAAFNDTPVDQTSTTSTLLFNNATFKGATHASFSGTGAFDTPLVATILAFNGSTDFIELQGRHTCGTNKNYGAASFLCGFRLGA